MSLYASLNIILPLWMECTAGVLGGSAYGTINGHYFIPKNLEFNESSDRHFGRED